MTFTTPHIFDRELLKMRRRRSAVTFKEVDFLHREAEERLAERLDALNRHFAHALIIGAPTDRLAQHPTIEQAIFADMVAERLPVTTSATLVMDEEWLPVAPHSLDAVISVLSLHHVNDLAGAMIQAQRALKPDGLFMAVVAGARSLQELRHSFASVESARGIISPRISPFIEVRDAGALLQRAGFALPVVDNDIIAISYANAFNLMHELRKAGETNLLLERQKHVTPSSLMMEMAEHYQQHYLDEEGRITVTAELIFMSGWSPHHSQQQPARRGSGQVSLKDVL